MELQVKEFGKKQLLKSLLSAIKPDPEKSLILTINVSTRTVDLNLSFLASLLKTISRVGLFKPYSNHLKKTVTTATHTMFGYKKYPINAIKNINP